MLGELISRGTGEQKDVMALGLVLGAVIVLLVLWVWMRKKEGMTDSDREAVNAIVRNRMTADPPVSTEHMTTPELVAAALKS